MDSILLFYQERDIDGHTVVVFDQDSDFQV